MFSFLLCSLIAADPTLSTPRFDASGDPLPAGAVMRLGDVRFRGKAECCLAYSADGKWLAFDDCVCDAGTGKKVWTAPWSSRILDISADGQYVAVAANDESDTVAQIIQVRTSCAAATRKFDCLLNIKFDPKSRGIWAIQGKKIRLIDWTTGDAIQEYANDLASDATFSVSADGNLLAFGGSRSISVWDTVKVSRVVKLRSDVTDLRRAQFAFSFDKKRLVASGEYSTELWNLAERTRELVWPNERFDCASFHPSRNVLATGNVLTFHDLERKSSFSPKRIGHWNRAATKMTFSPDGRYLLYGQERGEYRQMDAGVRFFDTRTNQFEVESNGKVVSLAFSSDGKSLASHKSDDTHIAVWDLPSGRRTKTVPLARCLDDSRSLAFSPSGTHLLFDSSTWDLKLGAITSEQRSSDRRKDAPDGSFRVALKRMSPTSMQLRLVDLRSKQTRAVLPITVEANDSDADIPKGIIVSEQGRRVAFVPPNSWRAGYAIWDTATGILSVDKEIGPDKTTPAAAAVALASVSDTPELMFSRNAEYLMMRSIFTVRVVHCEWNSRIAAVSNMGGAPSISADGQFVVTHVWPGLFASGPSYLQLCEVASGDSLHSWTDVEGKPSAWSLSPDGKHLATGSDAGVILLWKTQPNQAPISAPWSKAAAEARWREMAGEGRAAYPAIDWFAGHAAEALPWIAGRLASPTMGDRRAILAGISDLGSLNFRVRVQAMAKLGAAESWIQPHLQTAFKATDDHEARRNLEKLLSKFSDDSLAAEERRVRRIVFLLEKIGSTEASRMLRTLANSQSGDLSTHLAKSALARIAARTTPSAVATQR